MLQFPLALIDTEYTADESSRKTNWRNQHKEIIQIGIVAIGRDLSILESARMYVRPKLNPVLSDYIKTLTGIKQSDVNGAPHLADAWKRVRAYCANRTLYVFGGDAAVIADNFMLNREEVPPEIARMHDVRSFIRARCVVAGIKDAHEYTSGTLCQAFGIKGDRPHDALNDMKNLRLVLLELRKRGLL